MELLAQCPELEAVVIPVGGGGLLAGVAAFLKARRPDIMIVGVEEDTCDAMGKSLREGEVVPLAPAPIIADGIGVRRVSSDNLETISKRVDRVVTVNSDMISNAIMLMLEIEKVVVEASGAVPLAAMVNHTCPELKGKQVACIVSGGNIDVNLLSRIIHRGMVFDGHITRVETEVQDRPGGLEGLLDVFRQLGVNLLEVQHHRFSGTAPLGKIGVALTVETRDHDQIRLIHSTLMEKGYPVHHNSGSTLPS